MQKLIIIIIALSSIGYAQKFDYSKMSNAEKILMYNSMKKGAAPIVLEMLIPTLG